MEEGNVKVTALHMMCIREAKYRSLFDILGRGVVIGHSDGGDEADKRPGAESTSSAPFTCGEDI